jgi:predicted transcriptional regulator
MYRCNLSFRQLKYYLDFLLNKELLCEAEQNGESSHEQFEVTAKGKEYLRAYKSLMSLMN